MTLLFLQSAKDGNNLNSTSTTSLDGGETLSTATGSKRHAATVGG